MGDSHWLISPPLSSLARILSPRGEIVRATPLYSIWKDWPLIRGKVVLGTLQIDYKVLPMPLMNDDCILRAALIVESEGAELLGIKS